MSQFYYAALHVSFHLPSVLLSQRVGIRIILSLSQAQTPMIRENVDLQQPRLEAQQEEPLFDFASCQRMKKLTTHDIYRFLHHSQAMIVKLFAPNALLNYQTELACLLRTHHPSILKVLYHRPAIDATSAEPLQSSHLIVMREATRGDLNDYLPRYGKMGEKMARTYFKDLVESLHSLAELKPALIHPNLLASNLLLTEEGQLRICGWSEVSPKSEAERLKESVFSCGEILICLLTSFMPFYKKNSPTDAYFKFLSQDHIGKFWQEMQKKMTKIDKKFTFSSQVKDLLEAIFLKKFTKFQEILEHQWTKGEVYTPSECLQELAENQRVKNEKLMAKRQQEAINEEQRRKALHQYHISFGLQRSANTENQQFIKDCQQNVIKEEEIPTSEPLSCLKISASPSFVIASLKDFLRRQNGKCSLLLCEQFILSNHKVVKSHNYVLIDLDFSVSQLQEQQDDLIQPQSPQTVSLRLKICFLRQEKEIFADVTVLQSNFNTYYTNLALRFIQERIERRKEPSQ